MLNLYILGTLIYILVMIIPIAVITTLIIVVIRLITEPERCREQLRQQEQAYAIAREESRKRKEAEDKARFESLSQEEKLEILTQKYLVMLTADCGHDGFIPDTQQMNTCHYEEELPDASATINNKLKGFFGYEYNECFEGFAMNEVTEEEEMAAQAAILL